ncbi:aspartyl-tRNA(Asn)/glutamyl-tRNA(Gln) amidotransferase subunit A [Amorphus suaedae]
MPASDLAFWSATELLHGFARRTVSPVEATEAALSQITRLNGELNAFCLVDEVAARDSARASEARWTRGAPLGPVDGVPTSIKDLSLTRGWPTLRGSKTTDPAGPWDVDAPFVARMRDSGAVLLGKTTTPEFGWKGVTDGPLTGVTRNPWDPEKTPGGSSGGAAVACATGMGALHQGSDGGGSVRIPAAFTGVYGIKPTFGRVPAYPSSPFGTVAHIGPLTRTVADAALMLSVMSGPDPRDWYAMTEAADFAHACRMPVRGWRIAFCPDLGVGTLDPEVATLVAAAAAAFAELGAVVETIEPPFENAEPIFRAHWFAGAANLLASIPAERRERVDPGLLAVAGEGAEIPLLSYLAAVKARETLGARMNAFHETWDLLLTPTLPIPAFDVGLEVPPGSGMERWTEWTPFSYPFNLTQQPAASIPCGRTTSGLPVGLQIVAAKGRDDRVLAASAAFEALHPIELPHL